MVSSWVTGEWEGNESSRNLDSCSLGELGGWMGKNERTTTSFFPVHPPNSSDDERRGGRHREGLTGWCPGHVNRDVGRYCWRGPTYVLNRVVSGGRDVSRSCIGTSGSEGSERPPRVECQCLDDECSRSQSSSPRDPCRPLYFSKYRFSRGGGDCTDGGRRGTGWKSVEVNPHVRITDTSDIPGHPVPGRRTRGREETT